MNYLRIIFLTLIFALNTPTHSADQKPPVRPWSIENAQNVAKSTWEFIKSNVKKALPQKKSPTPPPNTAPKTPPTATEKDASKSDTSIEKDTKDGPSDKKTEDQTPQTPKENADPAATKKRPGAKAFEMLKKWQVTIVTWYKVRILPNLKNAGPWVKEKTRALINALKNLKETLKKKREEARKNHEEEQKKPNSARTKRISHDAYGSFGYDGFNLYKGSKRDSFTPDTVAIDPEVYFEQRTTIQTEAPKEEIKQTEQTTFIARLGGVPSGRLSRFAMAFTGVPEHDHTLKNLALNGGITFLAAAIPNLYKRLPSAACSPLLLPIDSDSKLKIDVNSKRMLFLVHANLVQYLVSHCIAYKSVPEGLKNAIWKDTNTRNLIAVVASLQLLKKDGIAEKCSKMIPWKGKAILAIAFVAGIAKVIIDQFIESRNLLLLIKRDLAGKPEALGLKEGPLPIEMRGNRYIVFNSILSKLASTALFGLNMFLSGVVGPEATSGGNTEAIFILPAISSAVLALKAVCSINNTYLLETDIQYLTPEVRDRVIQHATSHKILSTMMYTSWLGIFAQMGIQLPTFIRTLNKKKSVGFNITVLEQLKANLPPALQAQITIDADALASDDYGDTGREMLINLLLLNLQQHATAETADIQPIIEDLSKGSRSTKQNLLAWLKRYDYYWSRSHYTGPSVAPWIEYESDEALEAIITKLQYKARSPLFTAEINPGAAAIPKTLMNLLAQEIRENHAKS